MKVLSFIHWHGTHDTSAALVCDGEIVAAAEEERFSRRQHDSAVPISAVAFCLRQAGISMDDVDRIAFPSKPFRTGKDAKLAGADASVIRELHQEGELSGRSRLHHAALTAALRIGVPRRSWGLDPVVAGAFDELGSIHGRLPTVSFYDHHESHAALAFFTSGHPRASVATVDGRGDLYSTVTWEGRGQALRRLRAEAWSNSLGWFYRDCTRFLGLGEFGEGKAMGLSAYADDGALADTAARLLEIDGTERWYRYREQPSAQTVGFAPGTPATVTEAPYPELAAAVQGCLEQAMRKIATSAIRDAGVEALCLGGGVALNCASNGRLAAEAGCPLWVYAASGDAGVSVGAALLGARDAGELEPSRLDTTYLGPEFGDSEVEAALAREPAIRFERSRDIVEEAAARLASGEVIGWFQGRMELGPRALGNRSILADPRAVATRDRVNALKGREPWRPLAPSVLAERSSEYFDLAGESPFMLLAVQVRPDVRERIAAVVHVDGSARPQTVTASQNARYHALIEAFERRTGVPMVLNTSFNAAGEPIVCTPEDAVRTFLATRLDALVCGEFIVERAEA